MPGGTAEHLRKFRFKPGQSGNPGGRPRDTLKDFARRYLKSMNVEERIAFLNSVDREFAWRMAEGNPHQTEDITSGGKPLPSPIYGGLSKHQRNKKDIPAKAEDSDS